MPGSTAAEVYFIAAMMVLILIFAFAATFIFFRQYRKEIRARERRAENAKAGDEQPVSTAQTNGNGHSSN